MICKPELVRRFCEKCQLTFAWIKPKNRTLCPKCKSKTKKLEVSL